MKTKAYLVAAILFAASAFAEDSQKYELVLDVWPQGRDPVVSFSDGKQHLKIAVRNLSFDKLPKAESMRILLEGKLYISYPISTEAQHITLGTWRGRGTSDIGRGELAAHCINTPVDEMFPMDYAGRYLLWWSSGDLKSNSLVFHKDDKGLHRVP